MEGRSIEAQNIPKSPNKDMTQVVPVTTTIQVEEAPTIPGTGELIDFANTNGLKQRTDVVDTIIENVKESKEENQLNKDSSEPKDDTKDAVPNDNKNSHVRLLSESKEMELESMSSEEDTSDEIFAQRHFCRELLERKRYLFPDKNKNLPATPEELPQEFFVAALATPKNKKKKIHTVEEMDKLKQKFDKIRSRYLFPITAYRSWEDLSHLARMIDDKNELEEEIQFVGEWDSGCEYFVSGGDEEEEEEELIADCWEIVSKPPLFDEQGRKRNIIYLRRILKPVAVIIE